MNGVQDLGGTDGLGPVEVEDNEPVWRSEGETAAFGTFPFRSLPASTTYTSCGRAGGRAI
ncbi:MAG: hypothetical protein ACRD29_26190 [Acidimicrobiales bacterium]